MPRWDPDAELRLRAAAADLFAERGYSEVTTAEIAQRAGLTRRSFFRYFADKREVVFPRVDELAMALERALTALPQEASLSQLSEAVFGVLAQAGEFITADREGQRRRQALISQSFELQERERTKLAASASTIEQSYTARGLDSGALFGAVAMEVFRAAYQAALHDEGTVPFRARLDAVRLSTGAFLTPG
ncbi:helix-turn-helix domain-containing protein [Deinococcus sonorensis]|uniref:Helix-turn-helix domain-containing protein n=2 Tax=Deinococcus sonorensis TaxID=309891 RepID=A0AAU7U6T0_9DEIO